MDSRHRPTVAIIGAGLGGICLALALKRHGFNDFVIYEREDDIGGTWYQNAYPGCRCDVPAIFYSHSRHPKHDWNETHPPRADILEYWQSLAAREDLLPHIRLRHTFISATWSATLSQYTLHLRHTSLLGVTIDSTVSHEILVSAIGGFHEPLWPRIQGLEGYEGTALHTARWPFGLGVDEMRGKNVVVVGNGCSGTQVVTTLAKEGVNLVALSRSPQWVIPNRDRSETLSQPYSSTRKRLFRLLPQLLWLTRLGIYLDMEVDWCIFPECMAWLRDPAQRRFAGWIRSTAPKHREADIVPTYPLGGKRVVRDGGYLKALGLPNVCALADEIARVEGKTVITRGARVFEADYIVLATGFDTSKGMDVTGRTASTLTSGKRDTLNAYRGVAIPGFPNMFTMLGNNVGTQHIGLLFGLEVQAEYIAECVATMRREGIRSLEVKEEAATAYNKWLDEWLGRMVWTRARSYYRSMGTGRNFALWPGPGALFWWYNLHPDWRHFKGTEHLAPGQRYRRWAMEAIEWVAWVLLGVLMEVVQAVRWLGSMGTWEGQVEL